MTKANFKLQNEHSFLGILWYLLGPLLMFAILLFVFSGRLGSAIEQYPLYLLLGIINWNFFAAGTGRSMTAIVHNGALVKSLPIPLSFLVVSAVTHAFISHLFELVLFGVALLFFGISSAQWIWFIPVLLLTYCVTLGVGFFLAAGFVFVRDLGEIWSVLTRAWWFATPIFYSLSPHGPGMTLSLFNPLYYSIHLSREALVYNRVPNITLLMIYFCIAFCILAGGFCIFQLLRKRFIDHV